MNGAELVGLTGIEPVTSSLSGTRSNQLSYTPNCIYGRDKEQTNVRMRLHLRLVVRCARSAFAHSLRDDFPCLLRKEVIQPLVPQRLPCYDFIPITTHTLGRRMPDFGCRRLS